MLEGLAPAVSSIDRSTVRGLVASKRLFPKVSDADTRETLLRNVCQVEGLIPSLHFVFEGLKQLEPACAVLKELSGADTRRTIRQSLLLSWQPTLDPPVEVSEGLYVRGRWRNELGMQSFLYM